MHEIQRAKNKKVENMIWSIAFELIKELFQLKVLTLEELNSVD